jgi:hypothetical protein
MTETFDGSTAVLGLTNTDIHVAATKSVAILIQAVNITGSSVNCSLWITDASTNISACIFPTKAIPAYDGITDISRHIIPVGFKVAGSASVINSIYAEVTVIDNLE